MTAAALPDDRFWSIIEHTIQCSNDPDMRLDALRTALRELTLEELIAFERAYRRLLNQAYTWDLWGAAGP